MNIKNTLIGLCGAAVMLVSAGCSLDVPYENQFSDPDAISTPQSARELLANAYSNLPNPEYDLSVFADDFTPTTWAHNNPSSINAFNWQPQAFQDASLTLWPEYYSVVATVNALLERLPKIAPKSDADAALIAEIGAEAKTLKAYCYFQLMRLYGPDYTENPDAEAIVLKDKVEMQSLKRATVSATVSEIRSLLAEALAVETRSQTDDHWFSLNATRYLAAELELYACNYSRAAELASDVIDDMGMDALEPDVYSTLWNGENCAERILTYGNVKKSETFYLGIVYDRNLGDYFSLARKFTDAYSDGDCRGEWSAYKSADGLLGAQNYFGKYNTLRKQQKTIATINKMRLAGAVFIKAQALALDGTHAPEALTLLNDYLARRGAEPAAGSPQTDDDVIRTILDEKHKEFVGEGERYFDLKRYRRTALSDWTASQPAERRIAADDYRWLMPIPRDEYLYNENMTQNPGWPKYAFNE